MMLSELMHKIIDEFNSYDVGQISTYRIEGNDCEIKDSFESDFSIDTIESFSKYTVMLRIYYADDFKPRNVIRLSINKALSPIITILFVFVKMKYYKSTIAVQFYNVACRGIKYDTHILLHSAYERDDIAAFESILNADLNNVYENSYLAKNTIIDKLFRYNNGATILDITEQNIDDLIEECSGEPAFVAALLNYKNKHFGFDKEENFAL